MEHLIQTQNIAHVRSAPAYLTDYLLSLQPQNQILNRDSLEIIGVKALYEKQMAVINENAGKKAYERKRVPERLTFDEVALILMHLFSFKNILVSKQTTDYLLGVYISSGSHKGIYSTQKYDLYRLIEPIAPYFKTKDMDDVLDKIERNVNRVNQNDNEHLFIVNNGIYNQKTKQLENHTPEFISMTKIPIDYKSQPINPILTADDGSTWDVESWIHDLANNEPDTTLLIWQVIADSIQPNKSRGKSIWFYSDKGNNGKGTLGQLIKSLLGYNNYASLSVTDFKLQFAKESLIGVAANICDENDVDVYIDSIKDYKSSITGDDIPIDRKYEKSIKLQFKGINIQMMNSLPKTKDKTDSFYRRILVVPFIKSFTNNGEKKYIKDDYVKRKEVLEYVLWRALNIQFDEYIEPERSKQLLGHYKMLNNPVIQFWDEFEEQFAWDLLPTQFLYDLFISWSKRTNPNGKPMSKQSFIDNMTNILNDDDNNSWQIKWNQHDKVRTGNRMNQDEPLITEYNLKDWMDPQAITSDVKILRKFARKTTYRGLLRYGC